MADTWGTPSPSKSAWEPQPTDWQTTPSWQPQPTDWQTTPASQPSTTYWQTSTTYWQPPVSTTQWQPPPSSYTPSPVVSSTPSALPVSSSIPLTSRSTTSQIPLSAVASSIGSAISSKSIGSAISSKSSIKSSSTGLFGAHRKFFLPIYSPWSSKSYLLYRDFNSSDNDLPSQQGTLDSYWSMRLRRPDQPYWSRSLLLHSSQKKASSCSSENSERSLSESEQRQRWIGLRYLRRNPSIALYR